MRAGHHEQAVAALRASYAAVPDGAPIRLAKRTTNLFRERARVDAQGGLDASGLTGVLDVDAVQRTADVQGMCTYERLVDATLPHGLMPLVVPQLKTITLGGAVTGLGIESTSFKHGMPHESVLAAEVFTGAGELVTATPDGPHADLFAALPNSLGSLGYTTRLRIELQPIAPYVELRNLRFTDVDALCAAIAEVAATGAWDGEAVDAMDAVLFAIDDLVLVLARFSPEQGPTSDYTGQAIFYRSLRERATDRLTAHGYLWRWDTDWFWVSRAFGAQHPVLRRLWPARYRRSDVYHRMMTFEQRHGWWAGLERRRGRPERERVVQDVELPVARTAEFLRWFVRRVGMSPVWLCPIRMRGERTWPLFPLEPGVTYVNAGFWGTVPIVPGASDGDVNRAVEDKVEVLDGHKTLYSDAYYERATFDRLYGADAYQAAKKRYDPDNRLTGLYEKVVRKR
jgi:FAD/FMN-containing dehydrogenase